MEKLLSRAEYGISAVAPWQSADAEEEDRVILPGTRPLRASGRPSGKTVNDNDEIIRKCLRCPLPECVNCMEKRNTGNPVRVYNSQHPIDRQKVLTMLSEGKTVREICAALGCGRSAVYRIKQADYGVTE